MKSLPIVAIVGRANVGKSSLFNSILSKREVIVARESGTTRDSISSKASWKNQDFWIVDTAGMKDAEDDFELTIQDQITQAVDGADVIVVVTEAGATISEEDRRVAKMALRSKKPVILAVNKSDDINNSRIPEFMKLGIKDIIETSAAQNRNIHVLLDSIIKLIPEAKADAPDNLLRVALIGRPNVGKSHLFNSLSKKQQAIVANVAGTTRDINRNVVRYHDRDIEILDTAGIRKASKIEKGIEYFSYLRTLHAIDQADICLLLMTADELNVAVDQKIAGMIKEAGKGLILVVSKWDAVEEKTPFTRDELAAQISHTFDFIAWAPLIFTSSVTGQNVTKIFELVTQVEETRKQRIATKDLNRWLQDVIEKHPPAGLKNRMPKLNYMVQESDNECPSFKIFGSSTKFIHWSYRRYMEKNLRYKYDFTGTPLQLWFIEKHVAHKHGQSPTYGKEKNTKK
jgi:GTP-binding protein